MMYRPTYHEPHDDRDWEDVSATTVEGEETIETAPMEEATLVGRTAPISRASQISTSRLIEEYQQPDSREAPLPTWPPLPLIPLPKVGDVIGDVVITAVSAPVQDSVLVDVAPIAKSTAIVYDALQLKAITDCGGHLFTNISGTAGCIVGTAVVEYHRGLRQGSRPMSLADLYKKFNGFAASHPWDLTLPTFLHSLGDDGVMFYNRIVAVYQSGVQPLVRMALYGETFLRATPNHPVLTTDGFVHAGDLKPGAKIICRGSMLAQSNGGRDWTARPPRVLVNVKHHPYGSIKVIRYAAVGGPSDSLREYCYTRVHRARLVVEAALNDVPYDEFVHALKHNTEIAATFRYIPTEFEVHHIDENTLNDDLENLVVLSKAEHARLHNQRGNFRFDSVRDVAVVNVTSCDEEMTYDVQMEAPANNFCASGIVVHNTGKTLVAKAILKRHPGVVLAATTGIASVNLGEGTTINALLHYFNTAMLGTKYVEGQLRRVIDHLRKAGIQRILIDEKSMMAGPQLTYITRAVRESNEGGVYALEEVGTGEAASQEDADARKREEPPPMGITLVGDFGQLPPVPDAEEYKDPKTGERKWKKLPVQFAFDSPEWSLYAAHTTILKIIYRQEAKDFIDALHAIRAGRVVDALRFFTPDKFTSTQDDHFEGSTIFPKNDQVDRYNQLRLDALPGAKMIAKSIRQGEQRPDWKNIPETLVLKESALVMLLANRRIYDDNEKGSLVYANGDLATLVGKDEDGAWLARLFRTKKDVVVYPVTRENLLPLVAGRRKQIKLAIKAAMQDEGYDYAEDQSEDDYEEDTSYTRAGRSDVWDEATHAIDDVELEKQRQKVEFERRVATQINDKGKGKFEIIGTITYMPLRAAYGCTVHKTQGLTLDRVQVNINDSFMAQPGMLFVALSRARTAEGLVIVGDQQTFVQRCRIEPRVQPWL